MSVRAAGPRAGRTTEWLAAESVRVSSPAARPRSWNHARAARCGSENVVRATPPSVVAPNEARASKSERMRSASTRSTIDGRCYSGKARPSAAACETAQAELPPSQRRHEAGSPT